MTKAQRKDWRKRHNNWMRYLKTEETIIEIQCSPRNGRRRISKIKTNKTSQ
jgi:hypothetical protein